MTLQLADLNQIGTDIISIDAFMGEKDERDKRVEQDIAKLKAGQAKLEAGLEERDKRVEQDIAKLKAGQAEIKAGQAEIKAALSSLEERDKRIEQMLAILLSKA